MDESAVREEYQQLAQKTGQCSNHDSSTLVYNKSKNRYVDVLPVEDTRVKLEEIPDIPGSDYINANIVSIGDTGAFICSQAPLPATFEDFWRMVWEQSVGVIVILMRLKEGGKIKGHYYWPRSRGSEIEFGDITVKCRKVQEVKENPEDTTGVHTKVRIFDLIKDGETRSCVQLHYKGWPDFGVPSSTASIRALVHLVDFYRDRARSQWNLSGPGLVHCSAGIGRTGTFLAIVYALAHVKTMQENPNLVGASPESSDHSSDSSVSSDMEYWHSIDRRLPKNISIMQIVLSLRKQRNKGMVQTEAQYRFIYRAVLDEMDAHHLLSDDVKRFMKEEEKSFRRSGLTSSGSSFLSRSNPSLITDSDGVVEVTEDFSKPLKKADRPSTPPKLRKKDEHSEKVKKHKKRPEEVEKKGKKDSHGEKDKHKDKLKKDEHGDDKKKKKNPLGTSADDKKKDKHKDKHSDHSSDEKPEKKHKSKKDDPSSDEKNDKKDKKKKSH